jgi:hypothetical protein
VQDVFVDPGHEAIPLCKPRLVLIFQYRTEASSAVQCYRQTADKKNHKDASEHEQRRCQRNVHGRMNPISVVLAGRQMVNTHKAGFCCLDGVYIWRGG